MILHSTLLSSGNLAPMAGGAFPRRIPVNQYLPRPQLLPFVVALRTTHVFVRSCERVGGIRIVVELGGLPSQGLVASGATLLLHSCLKLPAVHIIVARRTLMRRGPENHILEYPGPQTWAFVTLLARHAAMRARECESCPLMIKSGEIPP